MLEKTQTEQTELKTRVSDGRKRLSDVAEFCYKCTDVYDPTAEGGIPYDDATVNVQWPDCGCEHKTSAKDKEHTPFADQKFEYFEKY